jgi:hypothetical protein
MELAKNEPIPIHFSDYVFCTYLTHILLLKLGNKERKVLYLKKEIKNFFCQMVAKSES